MSTDPRAELRRSVFRAELLGAGLPKLVVVGVLIPLCIWQEPFGIVLTQITWLLIFTSITLLILINVQRRCDVTMQLVDDILEGRATVTELLEQYSGDPSTFIDSIMNLTGTTSALEALLEGRGEGGELAKEVDKWGRTVYSTRGKDPRGPAKGKGADTFEKSLSRVDAMTPRPELEGREGELTKSEKIVEEANIIAAEDAQKRWERSEVNDPELIEAGVTKLGDLVARGHFGGPEKPHE